MIMLYSYIVSNFCCFCYRSSVWIDGSGCLQKRKCLDNFSKLNLNLNFSHYQIPLRSVFVTKNIQMFLFRGFVLKIEHRIFYKSAPGAP